MTTTMKLNVTKIDFYVKIAHLKSKPTCKLIKRIPGLLFNIKFTRLNFESAYWTARQALQFIKRSGKPCLVNLISKDTHLECFIYTIFHYFITGQKSKNWSTSDLVSYTDRSASCSLIVCTQWLVSMNVSTVVNNCYFYIYIFSGWSMVTMDKLWSMLSHVWSWYFSTDTYLCVLCPHCTKREELYRNSSWIEEL